MAITWTRIDDRLIHGQVASSWLTHVKAEQAIVVDDKAANNEIQKSVLKMAAPGIKVHIFPVEKFIKIYKSKPINRRTILIVPSTEVALQLIEGGVDLDYINFGGMRSKEGRTEYRHDLCFTEEEEAAIHKILDHDVKLDYQMAAYDTPEPLLDLLEKNK